MTRHTLSRPVVGLVLSVNWNGPQGAQVEHYFGVCLCGCFWRGRAFELMDSVPQLTLPRWAGISQSMEGLHRAKGSMAELGASPSVLFLPGTGTVTFKSAPWAFGLCLNSTSSSPGPPVCSQQIPGPSPPPPAPPASQQQDIWTLFLRRTLTHADCGASAQRRES